MLNIRSTISTPRIKAPSRARGVEQANLDQWVAIQGGQHRIATMDIHVVLKNFRFVTADSAIRSTAV
ncbi:hypothetical protein [Xanthomonas axonopodis]|uniref:Uncharacterized protein n=2 Tax=Xanthomonas axonopodis TaxID=53413 RepID=A0A098Q194_9XANT|nr:hypothetical protein GW15_0212675 [Xanthomonas axonopodis pv. vasculorum]